MNTKKTGSFFKQNLIRISILTFIVGITVYTLILQEITIQQKEAELRSYRTLESELESAILTLQEDVERLDNEATKESLARKKLNMVKPDEILYVIKFAGQSD